MGDEKSTIVIHTRVPKKVEQQLRRLVEEGYYSNISDALRDAARKLIAEHMHVLRESKEKPKFKLEQVKIK